MTRFVGTDSQEYDVDLCAGTFRWFNRAYNRWSTDVHLGPAGFPVGRVPDDLAEWLPDD